MLLFILVCLFLVVWGRKLIATGYQLGHNHAIDRTRSAFSRIQTKEEFDQMMLAHRDYYMKEDYRRRN